MTAKINHVAIVSDDYAVAAQFYQAAFGFQPPAKQRNFNSATVGDGYVGININPRRPARPAGLDHFGVEVDDVEGALETLRRKYPQTQVLKRPSNRPFAGLSTHDPDGNVFDLSQREMGNRGEIYKQTQEADGWTQQRFVTHFALHTLNPEKVAEFYVEALGLSLANKAPGDRNYYVTDGRVTLTLLQWNIMNFAGTGIVRPGPNHIGIRVESIDMLKSDVRRLAEINPSLAPTPIALGPEGAAIGEFLSKSVPYAAYQLSDNNNVLIGVHE